MIDDVPRAAEYFVLEEKERFNAYEREREREREREGDE